MYVFKEMNLIRRNLINQNLYKIKTIIIWNNMNGNIWLIIYDSIK